MIRKQEVFVFGVMMGLFLAFATAAAVWTDSWVPIIGTVIALMGSAVLIALIIGLCELAERWWGDD
jgi:hypothetical protein